MDYFQIDIWDKDHIVSDIWFNTHWSNGLVSDDPNQLPHDGNIFRATGHLCGEFTGHRWIPRTKASDVELWCFLWSAPWTNGWVNNREAGDLRRHLAHYDVIVM